MSEGQHNRAAGFVFSVIMVVVAFGAGAIVGGPFSSQAQLPINPDAKYDERLLNEVYSQLEQEYLGELPDSETLTRSLARGMVEALGDEYSAYLDPQETEAYFESNDSAFEGIGVQLDFDGQYTVVATPLDGYPGQKAGLKAGDLILEVDGEDVIGERPEAVATKIRGKAGTQVELKVYREASQDTLDFDILRERIDLENIEFRKLDNGVVVIDIVKFTEGEDGNLTGADVFNRNWDAIVTEVLAENPTGIIVDLRNNPGGYVQSVRYVAEEFLGAGQIVMQEQTKQGDIEKFFDNRTGRLENIPLVVLVNEASASASEILAGAIQDNERGAIVGKGTVGKGVEQRLITLSDNSLLLLVFKRWLTAGGTQLSRENPIEPDHVVGLTEADIAAGADPQLAKALELLGD